MDVLTQLLRNSAKFISFVFTALSPILTIILVVIVIVGALLIYDRLNTLKEQEKRVLLLEHLEVSTACDALVIPGEEFEFKFTFDNQNTESVVIKQVGVDVNLTGLDDKLFSQVVKTNPVSIQTDSLEGKLRIFEFAPPVQVGPESIQEVSLFFNPLSKEEAQAQSNTIVLYSGQIHFSLDYSITSSPTCQYQVRYN